MSEQVTLENWFPLITKLASKVMRLVHPPMTRFTFEDCIQEGKLALLKTDYTNPKAYNYLSQRLFGAMVDAARNCLDLSRKQAKNGDTYPIYFPLFEQVDGASLLKLDELIMLKDSLERTSEENRKLLLWKMSGKPVYNLFPNITQSATAHKYKKAINEFREYYPQ